METHEIQRSKILTIDDSRLIHRVLERRLRSLDTDFLKAECAIEGMEIARKENPDLILLDVSLPDMSGFEALAVLKNDESTMNIPVIFLTANDRVTDKVLGFELGAVDYVTKPFDSAELQARVRGVLQTQHLIKMLAQKAQMDAMTGLWNRAYFDQAIERMVGVANRYEQPLSLVICDIDRFKTVNDTFGHSTGDSVLSTVSRLLCASSRDADEVCRYGGEEFAMILPMTSMVDAKGAIDRVRESIEAFNWANHHEHLSVTASFGIADLQSTSDETSSALFDAADRALYVAKHSGRNRIELWDGSLADAADEEDIRMSA